MLCEKCRIREATIQYTEVVNGVRNEHHFCTQCAKEMDFGGVSQFLDGDFPLAKILSSIFGEGEVGEAENSQYSQIVCPTCGTAYQSFVDQSRFGCPDCYEVFDLLIRDNIKQLQGNDTHKGKRPRYNVRMIAKSSAEVNDSQTQNPVQENKITEEALKEAPGMRELRGLKRQLSEAIREEAYEEAAKLRDRIREMEKEMEQR